jgi:protein kinase/serine/threonine-protein kinase
MRFTAIAEFFSGHYEKAQEYFQKIGDNPAELGYIHVGPGRQLIELGYIYWKAGRKDEATELFQGILDRLHQRLEQGDESKDIGVSMAAVYAVQGNKEEALKWLQKAVNAGWRHYRYLLRYPLFENIRDDERFKRIIDDTKAKVAEMRRRVEQLERDSSK